MSQLYVAKRFVLFFFLALCISPSFSQNKDVKRMMEVMRLEEKYWSAGDIESYVSLYAPEDSTRMILSKGAVYGKENILAFYKKYWPKEKMGKLILDGEQFERISKKYYFVTVIFMSSIRMGKK